MAGQVVAGPNGLLTLFTSPVAVTDAGEPTGWCSCLTCGAAVMCGPGPHDLLALHAGWHERQQAEFGLAAAGQPTAGFR